MDGIAIWLLFLVFLPFLLFFWKILLMAWKSFLYTKKIKNLSDEIEDCSDKHYSQMAGNISLNWTSPICHSVICPPIIISDSNDSYAETQGYVAYGCFVGILVLVFILLMIKLALNRKRFEARNAALRRTLAHQNQLSTVSRSVDANRNNLIDGANNSRRVSDGTLKMDLPPTYEEVMKNFVEARETSTESGGESGGGAVETRDTNGIVRVQIATIPTFDQRSLV